jgi:citrate synthase
MSYLSAREAAAELGVSLPTLYAYVSRGLVRSEPDGEGRAKRYRAEDVRSLRARRAPPAESAAASANAFAWGAPVLDSAITLIGADGPVYRGVPASDLAAHASLEHVALLLWDAGGGDPFSAPILDDPVVERVIADLKDATCIDRAAAIMGMAGARDEGVHSRAREGRAIAGARIIRLLTHAVAPQAPHGLAAHRAIASAWSPSHPQAENLVRRALVLMADHELNASTFATRVAASAGANLYDCVAAGLATLKGNRHGGAALRALRLVQNFQQRDPIAEAREKAALGESFPGFGHPLYGDGDPRGGNLLAALDQAGADHRLTRIGPAAVLAATGERPNIDYANAVLAVHLGWPEGAPLALFAVARSAGWIAHAIEQSSRREIIRPRARYTGPAPKG